MGQNEHQNQLTNSLMMLAYKRTLSNQKCRITRQGDNASIIIKKSEGNLILRLFHFRQENT